MWHQLRRVALLAEILGHDASASRGRVLCAVGGVATMDSKPLEVSLTRSESDHHTLSCTGPLTLA